MGVTVEEPNGDDFAKKLYANDPDLIAGIKEGKGEAAERFYRWLQDAIFSRLVFRHNFGYDEAVELTGDIVLQILKGLRHYDPSGPIIAWVNRIVSNSAINEYRRQTDPRRRKDQELYVYEIELIQLLRSRYPEYEDEILRQAGLSEEQPSEEELILGYVFGNSLTKDEQNIILLTSDLGHARAAKRLGVTYEEARQLYRKALRRLRRAFLKARRSAAP
jgi:RNA polymerase sigma factor (sigma-70 family)